jgi:hypothetical protein
MGVSHLLSYLRSHQKKKRTSQHLIWDTKCVKKKTDMRVDGSLQKKMKKTTDQHTHPTYRQIWDTLLCIV